MSGTTSGVAFTRSGDDVNLQIFRGKSLDFCIIWGGSTPIDITGYQAHFQARDLNSNILLNLDTNNGGIAVNGVAGEMRVKAAPSITGLVSKPGRYELELTNQSGDIYRVISGSIAPVDEVVQ